MVIYAVKDWLRLRLKPTNPTKPEPNSQTAAGTGTAETSEVNLISDAKVQGPFASKLIRTN
jgi:hypothetical protein